MPKGLDFLTSGIYILYRHFEAITYFDCNSSNFMCSRHKGLLLFYWLTWLSLSTMFGWL